MIFIPITVVILILLKQYLWPWYIFDFNLMYYFWWEARRTKRYTISVYFEELMAQHRINQITPDLDELLELAEKNPPPQEWYDE